MHISTPTILSLLSLALALPQSNNPSTTTLAAPQPIIPPAPCVPTYPPPSYLHTFDKMGKFAHAFIVEKNLTKAFAFIDAVYIQHNPFATGNGPKAALDLLGPIWPTANLTPIRWTFNGTMGWLNYNASGLGEVVDRFRWEGGCIGEHWDAGEVYPKDSFSLDFEGRIIF